MSEEVWRRQSGRQGCECKEVLGWYAAATGGRRVRVNAVAMGVTSDSEWSSLVHDQRAERVRAGEFAKARLLALVEAAAENSDSASRLPDNVWVYLYPAFKMAPDIVIIPLITI